MPKNAHVIASWAVVIGAIVLSFSLAAHSIIFPESYIGKKGVGGNLVIMGLIFDIAGVTIILIPELANRVRRIGKKGDEVIAVISSQNVGSVDRYDYLTRGFFLIVIGFIFQIAGNLLSD